MVIEWVISWRAATPAVGSVKLLRLEDEGETFQFPATAKRLNMNILNWGNWFDLYLMFTFIGLEQHLLVHSVPAAVSLFSLVDNENVPATSWINFFIATFVWLFPTMYSCSF